MLNAHPSPLPLRVRVGLYETATSVLSRLAVRNGYQSTSHLLNHVPNLHYRSRYSIENSVIIAAALNDIDETELRRTTPRHLGSILEFDGQITLCGRSGVQGRVCPSCLAEDINGRLGAVETRAYYRDWWQVEQIDTCPRHNCFLQGVCTACNKPLDMRRARASLCSCGHQLAQPAPQEVHSDDQRSDLYLLGRLSRAPLISVPILDRLSFNNAASAMVFLGAALLEPVELSRTYHPRKERPRIASRAYDVFTGGWKFLDDALTKVLERSRAGYTVLGNYGYLQRWLNIRKDCDLEDLRNFLIDHARRNRAFSKNDLILGRNISDPRLTTVLSVMQRTGKSLGPIVRMAEALGMSDQLAGRSRASFLPLHAARLIEARFDECVDSIQGAEIIGVTRPVFHKLAKSGIIDKACEGSATGSAYFDKRKLVGLRCSLEAKTKLVTDLPDDSISLASACKIMGCKLREAISLIISDRITPIGRKNVRTSPFDLWFSKNDIMRMRDPNKVTLRQSDGLLGYQFGDTARLASLQGMTLPPTGIDREQMRNLELIFITQQEILISKIGRRFRSARHLQRSLASLEIFPVRATKRVVFYRGEVATAVGWIRPRTAGNKLMLTN